jgi:hypothetical protein
MKTALNIEGDTGMLLRLQRRIPFIRYEDYPDLCNSLLSARYKPEEAPKFWEIVEEMLKLQNMNSHMSDIKVASSVICQVIKICKAHPGQPPRISELITDIVHRIHKTEGVSPHNYYLLMHKLTMRMARIEDQEKVLDLIGQRLAEDGTRISAFELSLMMDIITTGSSLFPSTTSRSNALVQELAVSLPKALSGSMTIKTLAFRGSSLSYLTTPLDESAETSIHHVFRSQYASIVQGDALMISRSIRRMFRNRQSSFKIGE